MKHWMTAFLLGCCIFGSLALTAAVPVLAQRAGAKAAVCKSYFGRGGALTETERLVVDRYGCQRPSSVA